MTHCFNLLKMTFHTICQVCCILLLSEHTVDGLDTTRKSINFVISNRNECAVTLSPDASVFGLHGAISQSYNVSFPFELQLFGETIVSSRLLTNQLLREIPSIAAINNDLVDIWGSGFRIPLKLIPIALEHDMAVYASLAQMFGGPDSNIHEFEWHQFVLHCLESRACELKMFCARFEKLFICEDDTIKLMTLEAQKIKGHLDLSAIPWTVRKIKLKRNSLTKIIGLDQLAGKELTCLDIRQNPLEIDLNLLQSASQMTESSPLKIIQVKICQISRCLVGKQCSRICNNPP